MSTAPPTTPTFAETMAHLAAISPQALAPTLVKAQERLSQAASLWTDGHPPMDFDEFVTATSGANSDGSPVTLTERQHYAFERAKLLRAVDVVSKDRHLQELALLYGKGGGKGWIAGKFISYMAFICCHLKDDPARFFGLDAYSQLSVINVAPSEDLALEVFFRYLAGNMKTRLFDRFSPHFKSDEVTFQRINPDTGKPYVFLALYSKHSKSSGLDGYNLFAWVMDEAAAFLDSAKRSNADDVHDILRSSANTRFKNRWVGIAISYPRADGDFMMRLYERANKEMTTLGEKSTFFADRAATWDVNPRVSRDDPGIESDYQNDPTAARAKYECLPAAALDAFFEFPERIDDAVDPAREPVAYVTYEDLDLPTESGRNSHYVSAVIGHIVPTPGHTYFLGGDGGIKGDAFALSVFHTDDTAEALGYLCPRCVMGNPESLLAAHYVQQPTMTRVPYNEAIYCGYCSTTPFEFFEMADVPGATMRLDGWWVRGDKAQAGAGVGGEVLDNRGNHYDLPHVYEDLLVRIKPTRAMRPGEVNRIVHLESTQTLCKRLMEKLVVRQARFDPYQTNQMTQYLAGTVGGDVDEISFSMPEQFRRARLVKAMLHAGKITLLPNDLRDREWKQLQRVGGGKINHPEPGGSKDLYDAEAVAIWCAATSKCQQLEVTWI